ncbi:hypothetical protein V6Z11_D11G213300 [Gossypium hirsutum]
MACLDMYNSEHKGHHHHCPPMSPRISFSNDFAETQQVMKQERNSREAPVSSDFEFSVSNYSMMSADELFFKGFHKVEGISGAQENPHWFQKS